MLCTISSKSTKPASKYRKSEAIACESMKRYSCRLLCIQRAGFRVGAIPAIACAISCVFTVCFYTRMLWRSPSPLKTQLDVASLADRCAFRFHWTTWWQLIVLTTGHCLVLSHPFNIHKKKRRKSRKTVCELTKGDFLLPRKNQTPWEKANCFRKPILC